LTDTAAGPERAPTEPTEPVDGRRRRGADLADRTFRSLRVPNYRRFFSGMAVSATGQWLQLVAQGWLVLQLTGDGVALGTVTALQFLPILLGGAMGGVIADRFDKRRLLAVTQSAAAALAFVLGTAVALDAATIGLVYVMAFALGCVNAVDNPTRRAFIAELVPATHVTNAVGLNTTVMTSARIVGPALAGLLIGTVGLAPCFWLNGASFLAVLVALWRIRPDDLHRGAPTRRAPGQVREGIRYAAGHPDVRLALVMVGVVSTAAFNYQVVVPLLAERTFGGDAATFGLLLSATSVGSLLGSLFTAGRVGVGVRYLVATCAAFGAAMTAAALAPTLPLLFALVVPMGAAGAAFVSGANGLLQVATDPSYRGRVMALYSVVFLGSTPIGGPIVGAVAEALGARWGFLVGGGVTLAVAAVVTVSRLRRRPA
jgi:MFS family permease